MAHAPRVDCRDDIAGNVVLVLGGQCLVEAVHRIHQAAVNDGRVSSLHISGRIVRVVCRDARIIGQTLRRAALAGGPVWITSARPDSLVPKVRLRAPVPNCDLSPANWGSLLQKEHSPFSPWAHRRQMLPFVCFQVVHREILCPGDGWRPILDDQFSCCVVHVRGGTPITSLRLNSPSLAVVRVDRIAR